MKTPTKAIVVAGTAIGLLLVGYFQGYVHGVTGGVSGQLKGMLSGVNDFNQNVDARLAHLRGMAHQHVGQLDIMVKERPFGMHVRRGSLIVEEVFPGFPAEKLGLRAGCEIQAIAGGKVTQGTWLEMFGKASSPFNMSFNCPPEANQGHGPIAGDKHNYRVMVVKKPYGMNIQVNVVPRVVEVLPGSKAEAAGVKRGFVLTHIQDRPVNAETWFDVWQKVTLPCTLSFDTAMPLNQNNLFFNVSGGELIDASPRARADLPEEWENDEPVAGFEDIRVSVKELPFGMHVDAPPGKLPIVMRVTPGLPAAQLGVRAGDVLFKVSGHRVDSSTWFGVFQHAVPPFGLHFRRPHLTVASSVSKLPLPVMPVQGDLVVTVKEKPFGMRVRRSSTIIQEVFHGFPAQKLGVRKGCEILQIDGHDVSQGTWMELFSKLPLPFKIKLHCARQPSTSKIPSNGHERLSEDDHSVRIVVKERPFGMHIQANVVPRVTEVLPGYPAEAAGIRPGFVLTAINDQPVTASSWFDRWTKAPLGAVLTFDTAMPTEEDNALISNVTSILDASIGDRKGFSDFVCAVKKLPFGMLVSTPPGHRPVVVEVVKDSPAQHVGVQVGDVLTEAAGLPVDASSWFKAFQQAVPPFGLRFLRPEVPQAARDSDAPGGYSST